MRKPNIYIDGDACNVIEIIEAVAKKYSIPCHIYCNTTKVIESEYSSVHVVDKVHDAADFAILNKSKDKDIIITNDSGLAAMALSRNAYVLNTKGFEYTKHNIMTYLNKRYLRTTQKTKTKRNQVKGVLPVREKHCTFDILLEKTIQKAMNKGKSK